MFRKQFIILGVLSGILLAILGTVTLYGTTIDKDYRQTSSDTIDQEIKIVWPYISDPKLIPVWNKSITKVEAIDAKKGLWREFYSNDMSISFELIQKDGEYTVQRRVVDENAPFQGTWTISLEDITSEKTKITIEEQSSIENPFLRVIAHHVVGLDTFQKGMINSLKANINGPALQSR